MTSYPILQRDEKPLAAFDWDVVVFDEAHRSRTRKRKRIKRPNCSKPTCAWRSPARRWKPSGRIVGAVQSLAARFAGRPGQLQPYLPPPIEQRSVTQQCPKLRERIRPFLLRRTREAVLGTCRRKPSTSRWIELNAQQADLYESPRTAIHEDIRHVINQRGLKQSTIHIPDALLKLRQVCCDPRLVKLPRRKRDSPAGSAKLDWLMSHSGVARRRPANSGVLAIHQHADVDRGWVDGAGHRVRNAHRRHARPRNPHRALSSPAKCACFVEL